MRKLFLSHHPHETHLNFAKELNAKIRNCLGKFYDNSIERIYNLRRYGTLDFFNDLNIEILTTCNRICSYCPNSIFERGLHKNQKLMKEGLFKKIIDELAEIEFNGRISPQSYGEPLLDKRITEFMAYTRKKLPLAKIVIISNGDYLTVNLFNKLLKAGVNFFLITQHGKKMSKNIRLLFDYLKNNPKKRDSLYYKKIIPKTHLYNRGGLVKPYTLSLNPRCKLPDNPLVINYKGDVILCCNDYHSSIIFGNVEEQKLIDIWKSEKYKRIRKELKKEIYRLDICKRCIGAI